MYNIPDKHKRLFMFRFRTPEGEKLFLCREHNRLQANLTFRTWVKEHGVEDTTLRNPWTDRGYGVEILKS